MWHRAGLLFNQIHTFIRLHASSMVVAGICFELKKKKLKMVDISKFCMFINYYDSLIYLYLSLVCWNCSDFLYMFYDLLFVFKCQCLQYLGTFFKGNENYECFFMLKVLKQNMFTLKLHV